jgi:hypothetical protein
VTAADDRVIGQPPANGVERSVPWARQRSAHVERTTARKRQEVPTLPSWDPLPPGGSVVRRPGSSTI